MWLARERSHDDINESSPRLWVEISDIPAPYWRVVKHPVGNSGSKDALGERIPIDVANGPELEFRIGKSESELKPAVSGK